MTQRPLLPARPHPIIGMIHLKPLPCSTLYRGSLQEIIDSALEDAEALVAGGVDAMMVENYGDVPFRKGDVEPHTIAAMTAVAIEIRRMTHLPLGINVLRNDPISAIAIASIVGGMMVRVNVHTGAMLTDQGVIEGNAHRTLDYRTRLGGDVKILADVHVKHGAPLAPIPIEVAAADAAERGLADGLIVTGDRTGGECDLDELRRVRQAVAVPVVVGSGVTLETVGRLLRECDGAIVGSWLKRDGHVHKPVDPERVMRLMDAARGVRDEPIEI